MSLLALVLGGCASRTTNAGAARGAATGTAPGTAVVAATRTQSFSPYDARGDLMVKVAGTARGHCWTNSVAAPAPDAFRCFAGNTILDPCFASASTKASSKSSSKASTKAPAEVACLATPWSAAKVLTLTAPLPAPAPGAARRPWALALENGARCVASAGTVPEVRGINLGYHCSDGHDAALHDVSGRTARAEYGDTKTQSLQLVTVTTIWRG